MGTSGEVEPARAERISQLDAWLRAREEDEHLEFKEAKNNFEFEELVKYCCALANEGGGRIILGVTDKLPRRVVGTAAFSEVKRTLAGLLGRLHLRVDGEEIPHPNGRVVVFHVPSRPVGMPMHYRGAYWMRGGDALVPMTPDRLQAIFVEATPDYSALPRPGVTLDDLDPGAVAIFRAKWAERARRQEIVELPPLRLLQDSELVDDRGQVSLAALVLLGTQRAVNRHLAQAEIVFEYRGEDGVVAAEQRLDYRSGFLTFHDELWTTVNLRNPVFSYQDGLFRREIPAFNETAVREAILNAVSHRDYRLANSTFIRQWPDRIEIVSPGGFPPGVTADTILFRQSPRNRRIAEALARCGLVERSGQGADRMFQASLREGKLPPDFLGSDDFQVAVTLQGRVQDEAFVRYLERLADEGQRGLTVEDLVALDAIRRGERVTAPLTARLPGLLALGAIEQTGRQRFILAKRFYLLAQRPGEYTRRRGLGREAQKAILVQHVQSRGARGAAFEELAQVLPAASRNELKVLLRSLRDAGQIHVRGSRRTARWHAGPSQVPK